MDGFINVYKEEGQTSHDVVNKVRRIFNTRKVGHTGTLDPNATGVLPIAVNNATKVIEYMENDDKTYLAELTLGITTDTEDIWGNVLEEKVVNLDKDEIEKVVKSFVGKQKQVPPMYSALKVNGKKLYELAREGKTIDRVPRDIEIFSIKNIEVNDNKVSFEVHCSKGTYIRTLCKDIGEKLGCGATMSALKRVQAGEFTVDTAVSLEDLFKNKEKYLMDLEIPLKRFDVISLSEEDGRKYINGIKLSTERKDGLYRVYIDGRLYGVCRVNEKVIRSEKRIIVREEMGNKR